MMNGLSRTHSGINDEDASATSGPASQFRRVNYTCLSKGLEHPSKFVNMKKMLTNSHSAARPSHRTALTTFFLKLSKLAQGPSKTMINQFPRYIFYIKRYLPSKHSPVETDLQAIYSYAIHRTRH